MDIIIKNGVTISFNLQNCENAQSGISKEYVLLSVFNENAYPVQLSFKKNAWFDGKCNSCNSTSPEHRLSITIGANEKLDGDCVENNGLRIFSKMLKHDKVRKLTNFELIDIAVNEIK